MKDIDLNNFPEWHEKFLCGMLTPVEEEQFLFFLETHSELMDTSWLEMPVIQAPQVSFGNKSLLKKEISPVPDIPVFDYLAIKRTEEGLTPAESKRLDAMVGENPQLAREIDLYAQVRLVADANAVFVNKTSLKRVLFWQSTLGKTMKYSAAAAVIAGAVWFTWPSDTTFRRNFASTTALSTDTVKNTITKPAEGTKPVLESADEANDSTAMRSKELLPVKMPPSTGKPSKAEIVDPYLEPAERHLAMLNSKSTEGSLDPTSLNGYEKGLEMMMPLYLDNQIEISKLMALLEEENYTQEEPMREGLAVRAVEGGIKALNAIGFRGLKINKYYDADGNFVAYQIKGDGVELSRKIK
ncbi:MAG: hypothetical protein QM786_00080 [Breznakibacter sp.]